MVYKNGIDEITLDGNFLCLVLVVVEVTAQLERIRSVARRECPAKRCACNSKEETNVEIYPGPSGDSVAIGVQFVVRCSERACARGADGSTTPRLLESCHLEDGCIFPGNDTGYSCKHQLACPSITYLRWPSLLTLFSARLSFDL